MQMCPCFDVPILLTIVSNCAAAAATTLSLFDVTLAAVTIGSCCDDIGYGVGIKSGD